MDKCLHCDEGVQGDAVVCWFCGSLLQPGVQTQVIDPGFTAARSDPTRIYSSFPPKKPALAFWGLLVPGLGQWMFGQVGKAYMYLGAAILAGLAIPVLGAIAVYAIAVTDAYQIGQKLYRGRSVGAWEFF